jgi:hypothetical protein
MSFLDTVKNLKHLFDWTVLDVSEPVEYRKQYVDKGDLLLGYQVMVKYKHHGVYEYIFPIDNKIGLVTPEKALKRALKFSQQKRAGVKQRIR